MWIRCPGLHFDSLRGHTMPSWRHNHYNRACDKPPNTTRSVDAKPSGVPITALQSGSCSNEEKVTKKNSSARVGSNQEGSGQDWSSQFRSGQVRSGRVSSAQVRSAQVCCCRKAIAHMWTRPLSLLLKLHTFSCSP